MTDTEVVAAEKIGHVLQHGLRLRKGRVDRIGLRFQVGVYVGYGDCKTEYNKNLGRTQVRR